MTDQELIAKLNTAEGYEGLRFGTWDGKISVDRMSYSINGGFWRSVMTGSKMNRCTRTWKSQKAALSYIKKEVALEEATQRSMQRDLDRSL